ncbi:hypothetical protein BpHYR1_021513 [Brachionus plicatilis]|uniref:RNA-directed DNA polymerase from mobile element jockey-like n=1 Tax=Brachionus plicatilis TaxID=10195 RepID=A0A3M7T244_BRAPC|nr:hypothetical protein BpHYR1_021513 [Brachionus plicatilis]
MFELCKRSRTSKLMTALNVEPMERILVKRKLSFIMRLANNKFTKTPVNNILNETREKENRTSKKIQKANIGNIAAKSSERIKLENMLNKEESKVGTTESIRYLFRESSWREFVLDKSDLHDYKTLCIIKIYVQKLFPEFRSCRRPLLVETRRSLIRKIFNYYVRVSNMVSNKINKKYLKKYRNTINYLSIKILDKFTGVVRWTCGSLEGFINFIHGFLSETNK